MAQTIRLGELISKLEAFPGDEDLRIEGPVALVPDPNALCSYRGYYADLAIGFRSFDFAHKVTVAELLSALRAALGHTYTGYKGGDFTMHKDSFVWLADYGEASSCQIVDVTRDSWKSEDTGQIYIRIRSDWSNEP